MRDERWHAENRARVRRANWKLRHLPAPADGRRCIPVKLSEIPLEIRLEAADFVCRHEPESERPAILAAALCPSDDIHWIAA